MDSPDLFPVFLRWIEPVTFECAPPLRICREPHNILLDAGDNRFLVQRCTCSTCLAREDLAGATATDLDDLATWLVRGFQEHGEPMPEIGVVLSRDMAAPLASGEPSSAARYAMDFAGAVIDRGMKCRVVVAGLAEPYPEGTWLRASSDSADSKDHVLLAGMVGRAVVTAYSHALCTPGVSQMLLVEGRTEPFGHAWEALEPMVEPPTDEELERSTQLCRQAMTLFQERHGWIGMVALGTEVREESRVRAEIHKLALALPDLFRSNPTSYRGNSKRLAKLVRALAAHPQGAPLSAIAEEISEMGRSAPDPEVIAKLARWLAETPAPEGELSSSQGAAIRAIRAAAGKA